MRPCRHCSHENADHLAFCSQCGRKFAKTDGALAALRRLSSPSDAGAYSRTMLATPGPASITGRATVASPRHLSGRQSGFGAATMPARPDRASAGSANRSGTSTSTCAASWTRASGGGAWSRSAPARRPCWPGALNELGQVVLREGVQHAELTGLLEAIGRAHARREAAVADTATSESLQQTEAARLANQQTAAEGEWTAADSASRESEQILRAATADRRTAGDATGARQGGARAHRRATSRSARRSATRARRSWRTTRPGCATEQRALEEKIGRLDRQLADLRDKAASLRDAAAGREGEARTGRRGAAPGGVGHGGEHRGPAARSRRRRARDRRADRAARPRGRPRSARRTRRCCPATRTSIA